MPQHGRDAFARRASAPSLEDRRRSRHTDLGSSGHAVHIGEAHGQGEFNATEPFQVRRGPGGQGTACLFDRFRAGDALEIDGPYGLAWLREDSPRDIVCVAGGSGLSPMVSMWLCARSAARARPA